MKESAAAAVPGAPKPGAPAPGPVSLRSKPQWTKSGRQTGSNETRQRVLVFVAGGMTYSEMRTAYELSRQLGKDVFIGTASFPQVDQMFDKALKARRTRSHRRCCSRTSKCLSSVVKARSRFLMGSQNQPAPNSDRSKAIMTPSTGLKISPRLRDRLLRRCPLEVEARTGLADNKAARGGCLHRPRPCPPQVLGLVQVHGIGRRRRRDSLDFETS